MQKISQLMDGELDPESARQTLLRLKQQDEMRGHWDVFHVIGDALRGEAMLSRDFGKQFAKRLAEEPTVLAPMRARATKITTYALSAAASLAAVALVGWFALGSPSVMVGPAELAATRAPAIAQSVGSPEASPAVQLASEPYDGTLNEYLMAHTGFSPSTAIQGVAPYIRTVAASRSEHSR